ncbi:MAG: hypothetical protein U1E87_03845 [Alphaproteobacteria bacterium]
MDRHHCGSMMLLPLAVGFLGWTATIALAVVMIGVWGAAILLGA